MVLGVLVAALVAVAGSGTASAQAKKFKVVTTFTVIQDIAQNVAGDAAIVESITKPGAEIHDYQPTPLDIVRAQEAGLVLWTGFKKIAAGCSDSERHDLFFGTAARVYKMDVPLGG